MDRYPEMCRRPGIEIISLSFQGLAATYGFASSISKFSIFVASNANPKNPENYKPDILE